MNIIDYIKTIIKTELQALNETIATVDENTERAVNMIKNCTGHVIISGLGKSGLIGQKISATLASTGTPSFFLHPTEALHGDLGRIEKDDILILLSYSGTTEEMIALANLAKNRSLYTISITKSHQTELARLSNLSLAIGEVKEACPHNLAPTSSSTATLALGDALALAVASLRKFSAADFKNLHPGGRLGKLLLPIAAIMRFKVGTNLEVIEESYTVIEALNYLKKFPRRSGAILTIDSNKKLSGVFTDADLRRTLLEIGPKCLNMPIKDVVTRSPKSLHETSLVQEAIELIKKFRIDEIPVVNSSNEPVGLLDVQDLITLGVLDEQA